MSQQSFRQPCLFQKLYLSKWKQSLLAIAQNEKKKKGKGPKEYLTANKMDAGAPTLTDKIISREQFLWRPKLKL